MNSPLRSFVRIAVCAVLLLPVVASVAPAHLYAQSSSSLTGTVLDPNGMPLPGAAVTVRNEGTDAVQKMTSDGQGKYSFASLPAGSYTIQVDASGFNSSKRNGVQLASGQPTDVPITLELGNASEEITVEASEANSVAAAMAPMDALLEEHSARTEITQAFINNYTSPLADYGEAVRWPPAPIPPTATAPASASPRPTSAVFPTATTTSTSTASPSTTPTPRPTTPGHSFPPSGSAASTSTAPRNCLHHRAHALRRLHPHALARHLAGAEHSRRHLLRLVGNAARRRPVRLRQPLQEQ